MSRAEVDRAGVIVTIRSGEWGEQEQQVVVPVSSELLRELRGSVELSDDPFSVLLASPGFRGSRGDAVTVRKRAFQMRRSVANEIGRSVADALVKAFGVNDKTDGYTRADLRQMETEEPLDPAVILQGRNRTR